VVLGQRQLPDPASAFPLIITGDASRPTLMNGGLSRKDSPNRVDHIANFLASNLKQTDEA
jgi:hypothetical protein